MEGEVNELGPTFARFQCGFDVSLLAQMGTGHFELNVEKKGEIVTLIQF